MSPWTKQRLKKKQKNRQQQTAASNVWAGSCEVALVNPRAQETHRNISRPTGSLWAAHESPCDADITIAVSHQPLSPAVGPTFTLCRRHAARKKARLLMSNADVLPSLQSELLCRYCSLGRPSEGPPRKWSETCSEGGKPSVAPPGEAAWESLLPLETFFQQVLYLDADSERRSLTLDWSFSFRASFAGLLVCFHSKNRRRPRYGNKNWHWKHLNFWITLQGGFSDISILTKVSWNIFFELTHH